MEYCEIGQEEKDRRKEIVKRTREMILSRFRVEDQDETSLMADYKGYYLQISFSELHPLMVFGFAKALNKPSTARQRKILNELNLKSVLGSHAINPDAGCYSYRAVHWLDEALKPQRFHEILGRCTEEARKGYRSLAA